MSAARVAETATFLERVGIKPSAYTGYFTQSSKPFRQELERSIKTGERFKPEAIRSERDITATFGAFKSGRLKAAQAPEIYKLYQEAQKAGVKLEDPKAIEAWLLKDPKARQAMDALLKQNPLNKPGAPQTPEAKLLLQDRALASATATTSGPSAQSQPSLLSVSATAPLQPVAEAPTSASSAPPTAAAAIPSAAPERAATTNAPGAAAPSPASSTDHARAPEPPTTSKTPPARPAAASSPPAKAPAATPR